MQLPSAVRTLIEHACRHIDFVGHLPADFGSRPIYLSPGNQLGVFRRGRAKFEPMLFGFVERFVSANMTVWDIGANMGYFTLPAAHVGAKVIAFEPDPFNQRLLGKTLAANPDLDVTLLPLAVAEQEGICGLRIPTRGRSCNSLVGAQAGSDMGGVREIMQVRTVSLDHALIGHPAPAFVKCDAEGAEAMILRGATTLLRKFRPLVQIEMNAANADECRALLGAADYRLFDALAPIQTELTDAVPWEVIAIPDEQVSAYLHV